MTIRIAVICPSEIAIRRFMPALSLSPEFEYVGVGVSTSDEWTGAPDQYAAHRARDEQRAAEFVDGYGGIVFDGYTSLVESDLVDAVYLPLPPALHHRWAEATLVAGKHALVEKPFTTSVDQTARLVDLARSKGLAVHENYMFAYHSQIAYVRDEIASGRLGDIRLIRLTFGFPFRGATDFRYNKALGGGALLDCGGYPVRLASILLGPSARVATSALTIHPELDVDVAGTATLVNDDGLAVQIAFGMDNSYRCDIDVWGSTASLQSNRIFTAPAGFEPKFVHTSAEGAASVTLPSDDSFLHSIESFARSIADPATAEDAMHAIIRQSQLVAAFGRED